MTKKSDSLMAILVMLAGMYSVPASAQTQLQPRWVHGSWVNVRATADANAKVLTHLVANTEVQVDVSTSTAKFCAVSWGSGHQQQGFIACDLLGMQALDIDDVGNPLSPSEQEANPRYSASRAFWLQPSFQRLRAAGDFFTTTMLSPQQLALETVDEKFTWDKRPPLKRFPIPEFEAMKQRMREGVIEPAAWHRQQPVLWSALLKLANADEIPSRQTLDTTRRLDNHLFYAGILLMLRQLELPVPAPSYFKSLADIGKPSAMPEDISAQFQVPYAMKFLGGPFWVNSESAGSNRIGWWDIGNVDVFLQKPLFKNTLMLNGLMKSEATNMKYRFWQDSCREGFHFGGPATQLEPVTSLAQRKLQTRTANEPVFFFYSRAVLPVSSTPVSVSMQPSKNLQYDTKNKKQRHEQFTQATLTSYDLDADGIADFVLVEAWHVLPFSNSSSPEPGYRMLFVNAGGEWYLFDIDQYNICGD